MLIESVFKQQESIPVMYTSDGENISPSLKFLEVPSDTKSLVLIVDDPDAIKGTFDHWIIWNLPPDAKGLSDGAPELKRFSPSPIQGVNSYAKNSYSGPNPPPGKPHHYHFKLYALDTILSLPESSTKKQVEKAIEGHIIARDQLIGLYERFK